MVIFHWNINIIQKHLVCLRKGFSVQLFFPSPYSFIVVKDFYGNYFIKNKI